MKQYILAAFLVASVAATPAFAQTSGDVDPNPGSSCPNIIYDLRYRSRDAQTAGDVSEFQDFLQSQGYLKTAPTGYFGLMTVQATKDFQRASGISPTGFVGPLTRAKVNAACGVTTTTPVNPTTPVYTPPVYTAPTPAPVARTLITVTYPQSGNSLENSGEKSSGLIANVQWSEQNGDYPVSIYLLQNYQVVRTIAINVPDTGSYPWRYDSSLADGTYQIRIDVLYPARNGGQPSYGQDNAYSGNFTISRSPVSRVPSLTLTGANPASALPGTTLTVYGSGFNYATTPIIDGNYGITIQPNVVTLSGSTQLSFTLPMSLSVGNHSLQVVEKAGSALSNTINFTVGASAMTNPVVINSFAASASSINAGGSVTFSWSSNLTQNDISNYLGGCSIQGLSVNNVQLYVGSGAYGGASGQFTYTPPATATYTLYCSSNAKDGSPSASRQITVSVNDTKYITITSPVAGQVLTVGQGSAFLIHWTDTRQKGNTPRYVINIANAGGKGTVAVVDGSSVCSGANCTYEWVLKSSDVSSWNVLTIYDAANDPNGTLGASSASFVVAAAQSLTITTPRDNYGISRGTNYQYVTWSTTGISSSALVNIDLVDSYGDIHHVAQNISNSGTTYLSTIYDSIGSALQDGYYSLKVCAVVNGTSICDMVGHLYLSDKG